MDIVSGNSAIDRLLAGGIPSGMITAMSGSSTMLPSEHSPGFNLTDSVTRYARREPYPVELEVVSRTRTMTLRIGDPVTVICEVMAAHPPYYSMLLTMVNSRERWGALQDCLEKNSVSK